MTHGFRPTSKNWKNSDGKYRFTGRLSPGCSIFEHSGFFCGFILPNTAMQPDITSRDRVLIFLSFFTSGESQRAHLPEIPKEHLAFELCSLWFEKVFVAGMRYLDAVKGDYDEEASASFRADFTDEEWKYLERFHRFLELRVDMMPEHAKKNRTLPDNNLWQSIVRDARYLFELLEPDDKKRKKLTSIKSLRLLREAGNDAS